MAFWPTSWRRRRGSLPARRGGRSMRSPQRSGPIARPQPVARIPALRPSRWSSTQIPAKTARRCADPDGAATDRGRARLRPVAGAGAPTDSATVAGPPPPPAGGDGDEEHRRRLAIIAVAVAVIAVAGIVGAVIAFSGNGGESVESKGRRSGRSPADRRRRPRPRRPPPSRRTTAAPTTQATTPVTQTRSPGCHAQPGHPAGDEGEGMRHRHRWRERRPASSAALNGGQPQVTYGCSRRTAPPELAFDQQTADLPLPVTNPDCGGSAPSGINGWHYHVERVDARRGSWDARQEGNTGVS